MSELPIAKASIKKKAHALILLTVVWSFFSLVAIPLFRDSRQTSDRAGAFVAIGIWTFHAVILALAVTVWLREKPQELAIETLAEERKQKRWTLFAGACVGFGICSFLLSRLIIDPRGDPDAIRVAWFLVPAGLILFLWLATCCLRKNDDDPFYDWFRPE